MLYVMVGPSGAGKSTYIERYLKPEGFVIVSSDAIRMELNGNITDQTRNGEVFKLFFERIASNLAAGRTVVADATHIKRADRVKTAMVAINLGLPVTYIVVNRCVSEKNKSAGWREGIILPSGKSLIEAHEDTFQQNKADIFAGDNLPGVYVEDERLG